jgi:serine/threonine protein kinase
MAGRIKDEFEKLGELGRGGSGVVFAARHKASGRMVAVKALLAQAVLPDVRARFLREARVKLESPHIVQVLDVRDEGGQIYLIQELVEGMSLEDRLQRSGRLTLAEALYTAECVARALETAHEAGVVHRDVKPANILADGRGLVKLADFGIAKLLGGPQSVSLTRTGEGLGTLLYVAPEQAEDAKHVTKSVDIYSLGATLFHLLAGRPPFLPGPDLADHVLNEPPPPLRSLRAECPEDVASLVEAMLAKDPFDRPDDATSVVHLVQAARGRLPR